MPNTMSSPYEPELHGPGLHEPGLHKPGLHEPETLRRLVDEVLAGNDVILFIRSDAGRALLGEAADCLARLRSRSLLVAARSPDGLSLPALMAQVTGQPDPGLQNDEFLKRGFQALTVPDAACDRIVLLVSDANALQPAALRYIQFACRAGTKLQLVFAGKRGFLEMLGPAEFIELRDRLAVAPILTPLSAEPRMAKPVIARPTVVQPAAAKPAAAVVIPDVPPGPTLTRDSRRDSRATPAPEHAKLRPAPAAARPAAPPPASVPANVWVNRPVNTGGVSAQRRRLAALTGIGLVVAASVTLGAWNRWIGEQPRAGQQLVLAGPPPAAPLPQAPQPQVPQPQVLGPQVFPAQVPLAQTPEVPAAAPPERPPASDAASGTTVVTAPVPPETPPPELPVTTSQAGTSEAAPSAIPVPTVPPAKPSTSTARRSAPVQPRVAARAPVLHAGNVAAWGDPYPPPSEWRPSQPSQPMPIQPVPIQPMPAQPDQAGGRSQAYIGTYSTDANGVRAFRFNP